MTRLSHQALDRITSTYATVFAAAVRQGHIVSECERLARAAVWDLVDLIQIEKQRFLQEIPE